MPMLAAIAVPSSALRAKDVVISWSPLKFSNTGHSGCGMRQPPAAAAAARLRPVAGGVLDWRALEDRGLDCPALFSSRLRVARLGTPFSRCSSGRGQTVLYCLPSEL